LKCSPATRLPKIHLVRLYLCQKSEPIIVGDADPELHERDLNQPPAALVPRIPVSQFARVPPAPRRGLAATDPISDSPMVGRFSAALPPDSPRVMPETGCVSKNWKWWPGAESNHRHADFQYDGDSSSATPSRRPGRDFSRADRTALPDRAHTEPERRRPAPRDAPPMPVNGLRATEPNFFRTRPGRATLRDSGLRTELKIGNVPT
jgi:hypothetical protein